MFMCTISVRAAVAPLPSYQEAGGADAAEAGS